MVIYTHRSLNLPNFSKYYLVENDRKSCPIILQKFKNFLDFHSKEFLGYVEIMKDDSEIQENSYVVIISSYLNYLNYKRINQCLFFVLWDDKIWGKLEIFSTMIAHNLLEKTFNLNSFREMIGLIRGKIINTQKTIGPYVIQRMVPYKKGIMNKIPMLFKKEANHYKGYVYGHCMGYARSMVLFDIEFRRKVARIICQLSDKKSKNVFKLIIFGKPQKIWEYYFKNMQSLPQYLDYISLNEHSVVINCGVEEGAEIPAFLMMGSKMIYNIDPFGNAKLSPYVKIWHADFNSRLEYIEKWLYNKPKMSSDKIDVSSLKDIVNNYAIAKIDLIKADIEGEERNMTDDLINIAKQYRPQLAISIYHTQHDDQNKSPLSDLVDIPLTLMKNLINYNFYINFYSFERWEIVLYCIPKERDIIN